MTDEVQFVQWDWREQPDVLVIIDTTLKMLERAGDVHVYQVDTESDQYAVCIASCALDKTEIEQLYARFDAGEEAGDE